MYGRNIAAMRCALAAAIAFGPVASASSQVIEVGPAGVSTLSGPAVTTSEGVTPIAPVRPAAKTASASLTTSQLLQTAGAASDLSPRLLEAIAYVESRFDHRAISPKGAVGMMQLMPATAKQLGVDATNPAENVRGGADYLRRMLAMFDNNVEMAVAAYNAGPSAVIRYGGVPPYPETRAYLAAVMEYLARTSVPESRK